MVHLLLQLCGSAVHFGRVSCAGEGVGFDQEQLGRDRDGFMWVYAGCAIFAGLVCDRFPSKDLILEAASLDFVTITTGWCSSLHFVTVPWLEGLARLSTFQLRCHWRAIIMA